MSHLFGGGGGGFLGILGAIAGAVLAIPTGGASLLATAAAVAGGAVTGYTVGNTIGQVITPAPKAPQQQQPSLLALPAPTPALAPAAAPPTASAPAAQTAADQPVRDNAAAFGRASTILTSGSGASDTLTTAKKSLLGS